MLKEWLIIKKDKGFSLMEAIISLAIFALLAGALVGALLYGQEAVKVSSSRQRAVLLAEEGLEAAKNIADSGFSNLTAGAFGLSTSTGQWSLSGSSDTTGFFTRQIAITNVDAKRKIVTSTVSWQQNLQRTGSVVMVSEFTNWMALVSMLGDWTNPNTLNGFLNLTGTNAGLKVQVQGNYAYFIRSISGGVNFIVIDISNPANPIIVGSTTLVGTPTNIFVAGNYAYLSCNDSNREFKIIDISNPVSPAQVGFLNLGGSAIANGVFISGANAYVTRTSSSQNEFYIINISNPASPALLGSLGLSNSGNEVVVIGNYAYVATSDTANELRVINISIPSTPTLAGSLNLSGGSAATRIAGFGENIIMGAGSTLYTVNITTPASPTQLGSYGAGGAVNDISLGNNNTYAFLATSNAARELEVINISTPATPSLVGIFNATGNYNGLAYDSISDRVYVVTASTTAEFSVIAP